MLKVGTSKADITPPIGIAHANWGSSIHQVAEGIDMPLYCNILYIESESSKNKIIIDCWNLVDENKSKSKVYKLGNKIS